MEKTLSLISYLSMGNINQREYDSQVLKTASDSQIAWNEERKKQRKEKKAKRKQVKKSRR